MFCIKCGAEIADGSKFCIKCGNKIQIVGEKFEREEPEKNVEEPVADAGTINDDKGKPEIGESKITLDNEKKGIFSKKRNLYILIGLSILILCGVVMSAMYFSHKTNLRNDPDTYLNDINDEAVEKLDSKIAKIEKENGINTTSVAFDLHFPSYASYKEAMTDPEYDYVLEKSNEFLSSCGNLEDEDIILTGNIYIYDDKEQEWSCYVLGVIDPGIINNTKLRKVDILDCTKVDTDQTKENEVAPTVQNKEENLPEKTDGTSSTNNPYGFDNAIYKGFISKIGGTYRLQYTSWDDWYNETDMDLFIDVGESSDGRGLYVYGNDLDTLYDYVITPNTSIVDLGDDYWRVTFSDGTSFVFDTYDNMFDIECGEWYETYVSCD